jgi:hypothetical protein
VIWSQPVTTAENGSEYHYRVAAIRSLGDLRTRVVEGKETMSFWDVERLRFQLRRGPEWLSIDEDSGVISGIPDRADVADVEVNVTLEQKQRRLDEAALMWGVEKVLSTDNATLGTASQSFAIQVGPKREEAKP